MEVRLGAIDAKTARLEPPWGLLENSEMSVPSICIGRAGQADGGPA